MPGNESSLPSPDAILDGGNLDCGNGLLLLIRKQIDPLDAGQILEIRSTEQSVAEDLPAWCRMTGNELVFATREDSQLRFLVSKGPREATAIQIASENEPMGLPPRSELPSKTNIEPLSVMGIGSWPRPRWMLQAIHDHLEGRLYPGRMTDLTRLVGVDEVVAFVERAGGLG